MQCLLNILFWFPASWRTTVAWTVVAGPSSPASAPWCSRTNGTSATHLLQVILYGENCHVCLCPNVFWKLKLLLDFLLIVSEVSVFQIDSCVSHSDLFISPWWPIPAHTLGTPWADTHSHLHHEKCINLTCLSADCGRKLEQPKEITQKHILSTMSNFTWLVHHLDTFPCNYAWHIWYLW